MTKTSPLRTMLAAALAGMVAAASALPQPAHAGDCMQGAVIGYFEAQALHVQHPFAAAALSCIAGYEAAAMNQGGTAGPGYGIPAQASAEDTGSRYEAPARNYAVPPMKQARTYGYGNQQGPVVTTTPNVLQ